MYAAVQKPAVCVASQRRAASSLAGTHAPCSQASVAAQTRPQPPQCRGELSRNVSHPLALAPSQSPRPRTHDSTAQAPSPSQVACAPGSAHGAHDSPAHPHAGSELETHSAPQRLLVLGQGSASAGSRSELATQVVDPCEQDPATHETSNAIHGGLEARRPSELAALGSTSRHLAKPPV